MFQEHRTRARKVFCLDQRKDYGTQSFWDLDRVDDVRDEITEYLRRRTEGGTLEAMLKSSRMSEDEDDQEDDQGPLVHDLLTRTERDYLRMLSGPWLELPNVAEVVNSIELLLADMRRHGVLSNKTRTAVMKTNVIGEDLKFRSVEQMSRANCIALRRVFEKLHGGAESE